MSDYEETTVYEKNVGGINVRVDNSRYGKETLRTLYVDTSELEGYLCYNMQGQIIDTLRVRKSGSSVKLPVEDWLNQFLPKVQGVMSKEDQGKWLPDLRLLVIKKDHFFTQGPDGTTDTWSPNEYL